MATRAIFRPTQAEFPSSNFAAITSVHSTARRLGLAFDATTAESCYFTTIVPQGWTGTGTLVVSYCMASATSGGIAFSAAVEAVTSGDTTDLDASESLDTANTATDANVPGTAGYMEQLSITLTNGDSLAAGDLLRIKLTRETANAADTAAGDCYVLAAELRDTA